MATTKKNPEKEKKKNSSEPSAVSTADDQQVKRSKNGTFAPGTKKPEGSGRKPGTPNRTTTQLRNYFGYILDQEIESGRLEQAIKDLALDNPKLYLDAVLKIAPFFIPTLQSVEMSGEVSVDDPFRRHMREIAERSNQIDNKQ